MKIDTSKVTRVEIIDHQSEPTIGSGNFAKPMLPAGRSISRYLK